jgi:hypothetical protein
MEDGLRETNIGLHPEEIEAIQDGKMVVIRCHKLTVRIFKHRSRIEG